MRSAGIPQPSLPAPVPPSSIDAPAQPTSAERTAATAWRLVLGAGEHLAPLSGAANMAIDAALLDSVVAGAEPVLRFYLWSPACLSLGRNQPARGIYDPDHARALGVDIVRRPTGGLAVLHDAEVTYAVIAPVALLGRPRAAYLWVNEWLVAGLARLGVVARVAPPDVRGGRWRAGGYVAPCFAEPAAGEIVAAGRKLVGSAQRCERRCILQHGSILLSGDQSRIRLLEAVAATAAGSVGPPPGAAAEPPAAAAAEPPRAVSLQALLGRTVAAEEVVAAAAEAFTAERGIPLAPARMSRVERAQAALLQERFASGEWTWRQ